MVFSQPTFLYAFLPLVVLLHALAPKAMRNGLLLVASLVFYGWLVPRHLLLIGASIALNYGAGLWIGREAPGGQRRLRVGLSVAANLSLLIWFKYAGWLAHESGVVRSDSFGFLLDVALPIGISFFTFQGLSYVVDVGRGEVSAQRSPMRFALYLALFPQLIAGPIVRYSEIEDRLEHRSLTLEGFGEGASRFLTGLAKKVLVADTLAIPADAVFGLEPSGMTTALAWLGTLCYTLQIYFDFSGYSDMAIGIGRMLGFRFPENFDHPYVARSITEFWRRWHMTLSRWFRDYLYIPLGGNRKGPWRTYAHLATVFVLCGLWHGAAFTFLLWGCYHGALLVLERLGLGDALEGLPRPARHVYALVAVAVGWVLFRAPDMGVANTILAALVGITEGGGTAPPLGLIVRSDTLIALGLGCAFATPLAGPLIRPTPGASAPRARLQEALEFGWVVAITVLTTMSISSSTSRPFLYFQF